MELTPNDLVKYREQGYLLVDRLFSPEETALLAAEADTIFGTD